MKLFVDTRGRGSDVVMLHGWGLHGGVFDRVADQLADDYCLHLVDLPGHGASDALDPFAPEQVVECLDSHFPYPVHVIGWSLGGLIAQYWAAMHPDKVRSLSLVSTSARFVRDDSWPYAQTAEAISSVGDSLDTAFEATLERFLALQMLGAPAAKHTVKAVREQLFAHGRPQGLLPALNLLLSADSRAIVSDISCPTGVFHGARDAITPIGAGRWLAEHLHDARLFEFPHASHAPFLSHEPEFLVMLKDYLKSVE